MKLVAILTLSAATCAASLIAAANADEACTGFKWDVSKEHALFVGNAVKISAGRELGSAAVLRTDTLYELDLTPQTDVNFAIAPGKKMLTDGAFAGIASFKVALSGTYRVSVDVPFWIDVVDAGKLVATKDFGGQQGCLPHKVVEYDLNASQPLILQLSAASKQTVHLTITRAPAA